MGIKNLFSIIKEEAPDAIKEGEIKNQFGRKVAIVRCIAHCMWLRGLRAPS
jgi:flap endonuclease-1